MREHRELGPIRSNFEYMMALARIADLAEREDAEALCEIETLANYVESYQEKFPNAVE